MFRDTGSDPSCHWYAPMAGELFDFTPCVPNVVHVS